MSYAAGLNNSSTTAGAAYFHQVEIRYKQAWGRDSYVERHLPEERITQLVIQDKQG